MVRSLVELLALATLLTAVFLGMLRVLFVNLDMFEDWINESLEQSNASVFGLQGSWSGITPILHIERLTIGNSTLEEVTARIDLVESLLRDKFIAEWIHVGSGDLIFEQGLSGMDRASSSDKLDWLDLRALIWHSDRIDIQMRVHFLKGSASFVGEIKIDASNLRGRHRYELSFRPIVGCGSCGGSALLDLDSAYFWGGALSGTLTGSLKSLEIDSEFLGLKSVDHIDFSVIGAAIVQRNEWKWRANTDFGFVRSQGINRVIAGLQGNVKEDRLSGRARFRTEPSNSAALPTVNFELDKGRVLMWSRDVVYLRTLIEQSEFAIADTSLLRQWFEEAMPNAEIHSMFVLLDQVGSVVHLRLRDLFTQPTRSIPGFQVAASDIFLTDRGIEVVVGGSEMSLAFPQHLDQLLAYGSVQGKALLSLGAGHLGARSTRFVAQSESGSFSGAFGFSSSLDDTEYQAVLEMTSEFLPLNAVDDFVITSMSPNLRNWMLSSITDVKLHGLRALFSVSRVEEGVPTRVSFDFRGAVSELRLRYAEDWPEIEDAQGTFLYTNQGFSARADSLKSFGEQIRDLTVTVPKDRDKVDIRFVSDTDFSRLLQLIWETPLRETMQSYTKSWAGEGDTRLLTTLSFDLANTVDLQAFGIHLALSDVTFEMQESNFVIADLRGDFFFESPYRVKTKHLRGKLFDEPVSISIESDSPDSKKNGPEILEILVAGQVDPKEVWEYLGVSDPGFLTGIADYNAGVRVPFGENEPSIIDITSDLVGVEIDLPPPYAKPRGGRSKLRIRILDLDSRASVEGEFANISGWAAIQDRQLVQGSIGVGTPPISVPKSEDKIWVSGHIDEFALDIEENSDIDLGVPIQFWDFEVGVLKIGFFELTDLVLNGSLDSQQADLVVRSNELDAMLRKAPQESWSLSEAHLRMWANGSEESADPLPSSVLDGLIPIAVSLASARVFGLDDGETNYGSWTFSVWPDERGARIDNLVGNITGMSVKASQPMWWTRDLEQSTFVGSVSGADIGEVLDAWDVELNIESEEFTFEGDVSWYGSPLAFNPERLTGDVELELLRGRLLDVEQVNSSVRLSSLLNFSTFIERLEGKFSDVTGEGLSFNRVHARTEMRDGLVVLSDPAYLDGSGVILRVNGQFDLPSEELDVNVVITLGLDKSLPWYTTYLLMTNPVAGAGVFIGSRLFSGAIRDLLSMQYRVTGTLDEPVTELVRAFNKGLEEIPNETVEDNRE